MSDPLFQIIFRGKLLSGFTLEQARANLAQLFRTDESRIGTLLAQPKWVIKAGVSKEMAQKIQEAMRNAGLMVAVMVDEAASAALAAPAPSTSAALAAPATSAALAAPSTSAALAAQPTSISAAPPVAATAPSGVAAPAIAPVAAQPAQAATIKIASVTPINAVIDTPSADAPLAIKPKVAAFEPDLSSFSLAAVGAVIDASGPKKAQRSFAVEQFSLANTGAPLVEKKPVVAKPIDTSGLSLVAAEIPKEPKLTALHRELGG